MQVDYDDDEVYDPIVERFGVDSLVNAHSDPKRVKDLVSAGHAVTANAILTACYTGNGRTLEILLSAKPEPNLRLAGADCEYTDVHDSWTASDVSPNFGVDKREWYPLQHAATGPLNCVYGGKTSSYSVLSSILRYNADLFAVFKQPIWRSDPFPFPGEDSVQVNATTSPMIDYTGDSYAESFDMVDGEWQKKPDPECGYGLRCVLHSLIEDGAYTKPIIEHPNINIDLSHRDPQGRTLLHSVCRNAVGADAITNATIEDVYSERRNKPFIAPEASETSLFHTLRKRGADLHAKDHHGKNILHHLLEARSPHPYEMRPPLIRNTLKYVLACKTSLVNCPDRYGTYPIHTALQRLRGHLETTIWLNDSPLEPIIHDLLDACVDIKTRDSRGNSVLHYLADNGLAEQLRSTEARALCKRFCDAGVDANARNYRGRTALELLMDDNGALHAALCSKNILWSAKNKPPTPEQIDEEVFSMFDGAGARWTEQDPYGRTLLHLVAMHPTHKTPFRVSYLLGKGVNPSLTDYTGKTVMDIARESGNKAVIGALEA
ncbi:MAG: hypothetical protein M1820_010578 [Bogoriella megaspora]|nr:MAG: hypothetical protein M1820_010578 [Bogoriella megaspora]